MHSRQKMDSAAGWLGTKISQDRVSSIRTSSFLICLSSSMLTSRRCVWSLPSVPRVLKINWARVVLTFLHSRLLKSCLITKSKSTIWWSLKSLVTSSFVYSAILSTRASITASDCFVWMHFASRSSFNYALVSSSALAYLCSRVLIELVTFMIFLLLHSIYSPSKSLWSWSKSQSFLATAETRYWVIGPLPVRIKGARFPYKG